MIGEEEVARAIRAAARHQQSIGEEPSTSYYLRLSVAAITAHLAALEAAGWVVVPREPTKVMLAAAAHEDDENEVGTIWQEMLSAAPPAQNGDEAKG